MKQTLSLDEFCDCANFQAGATHMRTPLLELCAVPHNNHIGRKEWDF